MSASDVQNEARGAEQPIWSFIYSPPWQKYKKQKKKYKYASKDSVESKYNPCNKAEGAAVIWLIHAGSPW